MFQRLRSAAALAVLSVACSEEGGQSTAAERGRQVYMNVCIACHHGDPAKDGTLGPAVAGSSRELVEATVLHGNYPPGYTPKRSTDSMPPYPHLTDSIDDLTAFLALDGS